MLTASFGGLATVSGTNSVAAGVVNTVDFQLPEPTVPTIQSINLLGAGQMVMRWSTSPGFSYRVDSSPSLDPAVWDVSRPSVPAMGESLGATNSVTPGTRSFFRIVRLP